MREIKFRAWDKNNKCWLTDKDNVYLSEEGDAFLLAHGAASDYLKRVDVDVVFWTGLKDKNGTEIYDGDIDGFSGGVVEFNTDTCCYILRRKNKTFIRLEVRKERIEVVGNIYQNPDLLNQ